MTDPEGHLGPQRSRPTAEDPTLRPDSGPAQPRRRRLIRIAAATAAGLVLLTAGAGFWLYQHLTGNLSTFDSAGVAASRPPAGPSDASGATPVNVLLLGSDSRANGNQELAGGESGTGNSDTAILLHVYADHRHAVGVSIPRDSLVDIPPCLLPGGRWTAPQHNQPFNSASSGGGAPNGNPACSQNTVETLTGLRIDHTVVVDFKGFAAMTSAVGGVPVCVPNDVDGFGIRLRKGRQNVSGQQALAFVRARHGIGDGSDIGRMRRQQAFLSALIQKIQAQGFDLTTLLPLADAATRSLTVDQGLGSPLKLASFVQSLHGVKLADITFVTAPWRYAGDRVALLHPDADTLWTLLRQDRTLDGRSTGRATASAPAGASATQPADLTVPIAVQNGTHTPGVTLKAIRDLRAQGYQQVTEEDDGIDRAVTSIGYGPGHQADAERLARLFPGADVRADSESTTVTITLGTDYATALAAAGPSSTPNASPGTVPGGIAQNTRPADADACSGLSYG